MSDLANSRGGNLILIGFMGTGKSTVGKRVASSLGYHFIDTDEEIVRRAGKPITQIFAESGEKVFREMETEVLRDCCAKSCQVVSTGGGAVTQDVNRPVIKSGGYVIWLAASAEKILERVSRNNERPLVQTPNPEATIRDLLETRENLYGDCANLKISTDNLSLEETIYGVTETARFCQSDGRLPVIENNGESM